MEKANCNAGQTTVNKRAPIHYIIPVNDVVHRPPIKKKLIQNKFHDKAVQCYILWLNLNMINEISILQSADKQGNPHFTFMRQARNADTHALKQHRLSQNISPVCSSFVLVITFDLHLESESEKRAKNVDFNTAENIQIQRTPFRYF